MSICNLLISTGIYFKFAPCLVKFSQTNLVLIVLANNSKCYKVSPIIKIKVHLFITVSMHNSLEREWHKLVAIACVGTVLAFNPERLCSLCVCGGGDGESIVGGMVKVLWCHSHLVWIV